MRCDYLYTKRLERGWSQYDLSEVSGVPQPSISRAENGLGVSYRMAAKLAAALDTTPEELGEEREPGVYVKLSSLTPEQRDLLIGHR